MAQHNSRRPKKAAKDYEAVRKNRNFPKHDIQYTVALPQRIQDEMGGKPMNRLLLADAIGLSPSSSNFRELLSSSYKYGFTEGTEKADEISLTNLGADATQDSDERRRLAALRAAALRSPVFGEFFRNYANKKLPSPDMLPKILTTEYAVPPELTTECAALLSTNGRFVEFIREISGSQFILFDSEPGNQRPATDSDAKEVAGIQAICTNASAPAPHSPNGAVREEDSGGPREPKPILVSHGKNKAPLHQLQKILNTLKIPHKIVIDQANLGRPIPQKVKETIQECGSAILIFTRDERFADANGNEIWRPSENVVHELGAASFAYGDRIVIFKEKGLHLPTNFQSIGYIEFEPDNIQARTTDLLTELIGLKLVQVMPT